MSFLQPALIYTWLIPLACVPVLIHLINLMRHRRVRWAAMEFLLESQRRNRNWIRLKQLLLLLSRVAAVSAVVVMLAGPLLSDHWSRLFSGGETHHVVLMDDSLSMSDRWDSQDAFDVARGVASHLAERGLRQASGQSLTLLRFSDAASGGSGDFVRQPINAELAQKLADLLEKRGPTQLAAGPLAALEAVDRKIGRRPDERLVVYLVSDFRSGDWRDGAALKQTITRLSDEDVQVQLVRCVDRARPNLAITALEPSAGVQAAGVPLRMEVEVTNFGTEATRNVQVLVESQTNPLDPAVAGDRQALPAVTIERIDPGKSARQSFSAMFLTAGDHELAARLATDALAADNERYCVLRIPGEVPVLIVDGQPGSADAALLRRALAPGKRVRTGLKPQIEPVGALRQESLEKFATIYLVNIARLDPAEVKALESFVAGGGGVVFFAGEATRPDFVNEALYRDGKGIFPLPLVSRASLIVDRLDKVPDLEADLSHPIFQRTFAGHRNSFLATVIVEWYFATPKDWAPAADSKTRVVARLRNKAPLVVERRQGRGVFVAVLTTAAPLWNNWGRANPSFPLTILESQVYASASRLPQLSAQVGEPLALRLDREQYAAEVQFSVPEEKTSRRVMLNAQAVAGKSDEIAATLPAATGRGVYSARLARADGTPEVRRFAVNVAKSEGDLRTASADELRSLLGNAKVDIRDATEFSGSVAQQAGMNLGSHWLFIVALLGLLVGEQLLAYSASYHLPRHEGGR